jgi:hypothetical protein
VLLQCHFGQIRVVGKNVGEGGKGYERSPSLVALAFNEVNRFRQSAEVGAQLLGLSRGGTARRDCPVQSGKRYSLPNEGRRDAAQRKQEAARQRRPEHGTVLGAVEQPGVAVERKDAILVRTVANLGAGRHDAELIESSARVWRGTNSKRTDNRPLCRSRPEMKWLQ